MSNYLTTPGRLAAAVSACHAGSRPNEERKRSPTQGPRPRIAAGPGAPEEPTPAFLRAGPRGGGARASLPRPSLSCRRGPDVRNARAYGAAAGQTPFLNYCRRHAGRHVGPCSTPASQGQAPFLPGRQPTSRSWRPRRSEISGQRLLILPPGNLKDEINGRNGLNRRLGRALSYRLAGDEGFS